MEPVFPVPCIWKFDEKQSPNNPGMATTSRTTTSVQVITSVNSPVAPSASKEPPQWTTDVKRRLAAPSANNTRQLQPTIFRVPDSIRSCDPPAYTPQVVAIGPYHHGRLPPSDLIVSLQHYKSWCVRYLLSRKTPDETQTCDMLYSCLAAMEKIVPPVRSCYSADEIGLTDEELAEMMLLDGCFLITCLLEQLPSTPVCRAAATKAKGKEPASAVPDDDDGDAIRVDIDGGGRAKNNGKAQGPLLGMLWIWKLVLYDVLKIENQIPFMVLDVLFQLLKTEADAGAKLTDLALKLFSDIHPLRSTTFEPEGEYLHLLHLFHSSLLPSEPIHIVENNNHGPFSHEWIPTASELRRAGVSFKANKQEQGSFLDITFKRGVMRIPSLRIYDYSNSIFRNLIAFEQCYPGTSTQITTYAVFMDCLVDTDEDVNLLDLRGILINRLSTDEAVADLFNKLTNQVHYALDRNYLHRIFVAVNRYHQSKWHRYRAGLMRDYFSNPWTIISVVGVVVLIFMTGLQTFYTVYAYYLPNRSG